MCIHIHMPITISEERGHDFERGKGRSTWEGLAAGKGTGKVM